MSRYRNLGRRRVGGRARSQSPDLEVGLEPRDVEDRNGAQWALRRSPTLNEEVKLVMRLLAVTPTSRDPDPEPTTKMEFVELPSAQGPVPIPTHVPQRVPAPPQTSFPAPTSSVPVPQPKRKRRRNRANRKRRTTRPASPSFANASSTRSLDSVPGPPTTRTGPASTPATGGTFLGASGPTRDAPGPSRPPARVAALIDRPYQRPRPRTAREVPPLNPANPAPRPPPITSTACWACDQEGHKYNQCPAPRFPHCFVCGWRGYTARTCPTHRRVWECAYVAHQLARQADLPKPVAALEAPRIPALMSLRIPPPDVDPTPPPSPPRISLPPGTDNSLSSAEMLRMIRDLLDRHR